MASIKKVIISIMLSLVAFGVQSQNIKQDIQRQKQQQEERAAEQAREAEAQRYRELAMTREAVRKAYMQSDEYKILESISNDFDKWNIKDEFESTVAYEDRLKHQSIAKFYQICEENIRSFFERINIETELKQYDADKQYFPVEIYFVSQFCWDYTEGAHYTIAVPVSIEDAQKFKNDFRSRSWQKCEVYNMVFTDDIDNKLVPTKVSYNGREYNVPIENPREVTFSFSELGLQNQYCADAVWNMNMIKLAEEERIAEQRRLDSIACIKYNRKLDSIVTTYNQKLLQEEYNYEKKTVKSHHLECGQGIENRFNDAMNEINNSFKSIMALAEAEKQRIQDSIACVVYNNKLDSIVDTYNQQLLQEEYNYDKKTVKSRNLECGHGIENRFKNAKKEIDNNFNSIMAVADRNKKTIENYKQTYSDNIKDLAFKMFNSSDWHAYNNCPDYLMDNIVTGSRDRSYSNELVEKLIEYTVDTNTQLTKEWAKNGQYFDNKADFFNSYLKFDHYHKYVGLNPEYKTILKEKKKTKK